MSWFKKRWFIILLALSLSLSGILGGIIYYIQHSYTAPTGDSHSSTVIIASGTSVDKIITQLVDQKIITSPLLFKIHLYSRYYQQSLKAGEYAFETPRTLQSVLEKLIKGQTVIHKFTVVEGQTSQSVLENLNQIKILQGKVNLPLVEGSLYPETYYYSYGDQRQHLIERMIKAQQKVLADLWLKRDPTIPLTSPNQALILASIVEKETHLISEQAQVAGLFYNRLKLNMPLQSDPTVLYGFYISENKPLNRDLSRAELAQDHPYNTYIHKGLPPGPICNPGISALTATLHPQETKDLYFVTDGTGGHVFSKTYAEHRHHHQALRERRKKYKP